MRLSLAVVGASTGRSGEVDWEGNENPGSAQECVEVRTFICGEYKTFLKTCMYMYVFSAFFM